MGGTGKGPRSQAAILQQQQASEPSLLQSLAPVSMMSYATSSAVFFNTAMSATSGIGAFDGARSFYLSDDAVRYVRPEEETFNLPGPMEVIVNNKPRKMRIKE